MVEERFVGRYHDSVDSSLRHQMVIGRPRMIGFILVHRNRGTAVALSGGSLDQRRSGAKCLSFVHCLAWERAEDMANSFQATSPKQDRQSRPAVGGRVRQSSERARDREREVLWAQQYDYHLTSTSGVTMSRMRQ